MTDWRQYRAKRRHEPLTQYDCHDDSCMMYAMNTPHALEYLKPSEILQSLQSWPGVAFARPSNQPYRKLALFFSDDDFHFARLDQGVWTEKFRGTPPQTLHTDTRGHPVSTDTSYTFAMYLYLLANFDLTEIPSVRHDDSRYNRDGNPRHDFRRRQQYQSSRS